MGPRTPLLSDSEPDLPLRNARQGGAARGIHDLQTPARWRTDAQGQPRGRPASTAGPTAGPQDTTRAERLSTLVAGSGAFT